MAHTPGPYSRYIGESNDTIAVTKWIDGPNGGKMAISLAKMPLPGKHLSQEQINDNALLFEAAPDLLAALKDMLAGWRYIRHHNGDLCGVGWDRCEDATVAVIARAEGGGS